MSLTVSPERFKQLFPHASVSTLKANGQIPDPEPEHHQAAALGGASERKKESAPRVAVRFVGYRVRPLDPDNFAGSVKDLLDGLRYAHLISGDEPWRIRLETEQIKVGTYAEERTEIILIWPEET